MLGAIHNIFTPSHSAQSFACVYVALTGSFYSAQSFACVYVALTGSFYTAQSFACVYVALTGSFYPAQSFACVYVALTGGFGQNRKLHKPSLLTMTHKKHFDVLRFKTCSTLIQRLSVI